MSGVISNLKSRLSNFFKLFLFPGDKTRFERNLRRLRNFVILALVSAILWYVTISTRLDTRIRAPLLFLRPYWLVLLLWSSLLALFSTRKLIDVIRTEPSFSLFPEMQENWSFIKQEMAALNLSPKEVPIILVLGHRPIEGVHFFDHLQLRLRDIRLRNDSEFHFQADLTDSAMIITCQNATALGTLMRRVETRTKPFLRSTTNVIKSRNNNRSSNAIIGLSDELLSSDEPDQLNSEELILPDSEIVHQELDVSIVSEDEINLCSARLKYLCELISADRYPYCPVNGVILVVSKEVMDSDQLISTAIEMSKTDMESIRSATGQDFPFSVLASNMHHIQGFEDFVNKLDASSKMRYLGFALHTRLDTTPKVWINQIRKGLQWFRLRVLPALVTKEMIELPPSALGPQSAGRGSVIISNHKVYRFLQQTDMQLRQLEFFCLRISQFHLKRKAGNPRFAGLFLTGMGNREIGPWVFIHEFIKHMLSQQDSISWTTEAFAKNQKYHRIAILMFLIVIASLLALLSVLTWFYFR